jgi:hypothetical protein
VQVHKADEKEMAIERVDRLVSMMAAQPKSLAWKVRAGIGERAKRCEMPDSDSDSMLVYALTTRMIAPPLFPTP